MCYFLYVQCPNSKFELKKKNDNNIMIQAFVFEILKLSLCPNYNH